MNNITFKTKKYCFYITILFFLGGNLKTYAQEIIYNFETDTPGNAPANITAQNGIAVIEANTNNKTQTLTGSGPTTGLSFDMDLFPSSKNYSVIWKETYTEAGRSAFTLRGGASSRSDSRMTGYVFQVNTNLQNLRIYRLIRQGGIVQL